MLKALVSVALVVSGTDALAAANQTDFGIRTVGVRTLSGQKTNVVTNSTSKALLVSNDPSPARSYNPLFTNPSLSSRPAIDLGSVAGLGSHWGRVTSTYRSPAHNRRVGGVRNSWHMQGRAIDIARRPGVSHSQIAAAYRNAGYYLIESLDEGDHSHFAFGSGGGYVRPARTVERAGASAANATRWRIVTAASAAFK